MKIIINAAEEYNEKGFLIYAANFSGAYVRGKTREIAFEKFQKEISEYLLWRDNIVYDNLEVIVSIVQSKQSTLDIHDADSDIIFDNEKLPLSNGEYFKLKALALKSASDFFNMYKSIPDKNTCKPPFRKTFYGTVPRSAEEMYQHTKNVNSYYFGEIGIKAENSPDILSCREAGFRILEEQTDILENRVFMGSGDELWSLRKVIRRFIWHDRIHAKAMYRLAESFLKKDSFNNPFMFDM